MSNLCFNNALPAAMLWARTRPRSVQKRDKATRSSRNAILGIALGWLEERADSLGLASLPILRGVIAEPNQPGIDAPRLEGHLQVLRRTYKEFGQWFRIVHAFTAKFTGRVEVYNPHEQEKQPERLRYSPWEAIRIAMRHGIALEVLAKPPVIFAGMSWEEIQNRAVKQNEELDREQVEATREEEAVEAPIEKPPEGALGSMADRMAHIISRQLLVLAEIHDMRPPPQEDTRPVKVKLAPAHIELLQSVQTSNVAMLTEIRELTVAQRSLEDMVLDLASQVPGLILEKTPATLQLVTGVSPTASLGAPPVDDELEVVPQETTQLMREWRQRIYPNRPRVVLFGGKLNRGDANMKKVRHALWAGDIKLIPTTGVSQKVQRQELRKVKRADCDILVNMGQASGLGVANEVREHAKNEGIAFAACATPDKDCAEILVHLIGLWDKVHDAPTGAGKKEGARS